MRAVTDWACARAREDLKLPRRGCNVCRLFLSCRGGHGTKNWVEDADFKVFDDLSSADFITE